MEKKLAYSEQVRGELEKKTELLRQVLKDKEKEIRDAKDQLRQAKEVVIHEYRDSDALLVELGTSFAEGFDDACVRSKLLILIWTCPMLLLKSRTNQQLSPSFQRVRRIYLRTMPPLTFRVTGGAATEGQLKTIEEGTRHPEDVQTVEEKDNAPTVQQ